MTEGKKPNLQTTEGLMAEWRAAHPEALSRRAKYGVLDEKLRKLREVDPAEADRLESMLDQAQSKDGK